MKLPSKTCITGPTATIALSDKSAVKHRAQRAGASHHVTRLNERTEGLKGLKAGLDSTDGRLSGRACK